MTFGEILDFLKKKGNKRKKVRCVSIGMYEQNLSSIEYWITSDKRDIDERERKINFRKMLNATDWKIG